MKIFSCEKNRQSKKLKFLNITIFKRVKHGEKKKYYLFGVQILTKSALKRFYAKYRHLLAPYDEIYLINANIGEAYLLFKYFTDASNIDKILFITTNQRHVQLIKLLCPRCHYIYDETVNFDLFPAQFKVHGKKCTVLFNHEYYINLERDMREERENAHYFQRMREFLGKDNVTPNTATIDEITYNQVKEKLKSIGVNVDKFALIIPEATSCSNIPEEILSKLNSTLKKQGFDIFYNSIPKDYQIYEKTYKFSLEEILYCAKMAKLIIAARSGLAEFLLEAHTKMYLLYSDFQNRAQDEVLSAQKVLKGFSVKELPNVNTDLIQEIVIENIDTCIKEIKILEE